jgi:hypothetical protein
LEKQFLRANKLRFLHWGDTVSRKVKPGLVTVIETRNLGPTSVETITILKSDWNHIKRDLARAKRGSWRLDNAGWALISLGVGAWLGAVTVEASWAITSWIVGGLLAFVLGGTLLFIDSRLESKSTLAIEEILADMNGIEAKMRRR